MKPAFRPCSLGPMAALALTLALPGPAHARPSSPSKTTAPAAVVAVGAVLLACGAVVTGMSGYFYNRAPGEQTLMGYQTDQRNQDTVLYAGVPTLIAGAIMVGVGAPFLASAIDAQKEQGRTSLWIAPAATGLALGGRF